MKTELFYWITAMVYLGICTVSDIRRRKVSWLFSLLFGTGLFCIHMIRQDTAVTEFLFGILPGIFLLGISAVTGEAIGYGDGLAVAVCGLALGAEPAIRILMTALFLSAGWSLLLLVLRKAGKKESFPFVPFLLTAQIVTLMV